MIEIKNCLPQSVVPHYIARQSTRITSESEAFRRKLIESRRNAAARGNLKSGAQEVSEWALKQEMSDALAIGLIEDAIETCKLYGIPLTPAMCAQLLQASQDQLTAQYRSALTVQAQGIADVKIPLSVRQQMGGSPRFSVLNRIRVILDQASVESQRGKEKMATNDKVAGANAPRNVRCFDLLIASPSDVEAERQIVVECIEDWNAQHSRAMGVIIQPRRWQFDAMPDTGDRPQSFINRQIVDTSHLLVGLFWSRLGSPTGIAASGTIEEIDRFVRAEKPAMLYFSKMPLPYDHDQTQLAALQDYKKRIQQTSFYFEFGSHEVLRRLVSLHIGHRMHDLTGAPDLTPQPEASAVRSNTNDRKAGRADPGLVIGFGRLRVEPSHTILRFNENEGVPSLCLSVWNGPAENGKIIDVQSVFATLIFTGPSSTTTVNRACWIDRDENEVRIELAGTEHIMVGMPQGEDKWLTFNNPNKYSDEIHDWNDPGKEVEWRTINWGEGASFTVDVRIVSSAVATKGQVFAHRRFVLACNGISFTATWAD